MTKNAPKRICINVDAMIWDHEEIRALSDSAALRYIYLVAWSKCREKDGIVTSRAVIGCGATEADIKELMDAKFLTPHPEGWLIPKYEEWQQTAAEERTMRAIQSAKGIRGNEIRWGVKTDPEPHSSPAPVALGPVASEKERESWLGIAFGAWPAPGAGFSVEHPKKVRPAFFDSVHTAEEWVQFQAALDAKLTRYRADPAPKEMKRKFFGSFVKFCANWRDEALPIPVVTPTPKPEPTAEIAPTPVYVDDGEIL